MLCDIFAAAMVMSVLRPSKYLKQFCSESMGVLFLVKTFVFHVLHFKCHS